jgi:methylmalonyl-CoA/ethylmalonyl-CoA epimerase
MIKKIDHIAIAVRDIDSAARFYHEQLGLEVSARETVPQRKVRVAFIQLGATRIELVQPDSPESPIAKFLEKRETGIHHICFEVDDIAAELSRLAGAGVKLIDSAPQSGAHGNQTGFLHPSAANGVLIELTQPPPTQTH